jgi:GTP 3',8-cyclase
MLKPLVSPGNRPIHYLRISVTDRCDMRCQYCMPEGDVPFLPRDLQLSSDEIARVAGVSARMGVTKIRLTGGEPLMRHDIVDLVRALARVPGIAEVVLTTNGSRLERYALPLAAAGLKRVNVSLDSLNRGQFQEITRGGSLARTLAGLEAADQAGLKPIKINTVVMKGINDDQIPALVQLGVSRNWQVRFIEYMPVSATFEAWDKHFMPAGAILEAISGRCALEELPLRSGDPARLYRVKGTETTVGVITPVSQHFCDSCNRIRLTADGHVRSCLLAPGDSDLRTLLRAGCSDEAIAEVLEAAVALKPEWHQIQPGMITMANHTMREIGG